MSGKVGKLHGGVTVACKSFGNLLQLSYMLSHAVNVDYAMKGTLTNRGQYFWKYEKPNSRPFHRYEPHVTQLGYLL